MQLPRLTSCTLLSIGSFCLLILGIFVDTNIIRQPITPAVSLRFFSTDLDTPWTAVFGQAGAVIYVDTGGDDSAPGTSTAPVRTIQHAVNLALANDRHHVGTRILVHPGMYRESIAILPSQDTTRSPIILEGIQPGQVTISGSDIWDSGWTHYQNQIYVHPWPFEWGTAPRPRGWEHIDLPEIILRREMVFANGARLDQVLSLDLLRPNSFFVSEADHRLYVWLPDSVAPEAVTIEIATRPQTLRVQNAANITLRGLVIQHDNTPLDGSAALIADSANILIEDCAFDWNNWGGFNLWNSHDIIVRQTQANHNGGHGSGAAIISNLTFEDVETSYNNWRGYQGEFLGWSVAGTKHLHIHRARYIRHRSTHNFTRGFWADSDFDMVTVDSAYWCDNLTNGVFLEAVQGPFEIRDSTICRNHDSGIFTGNLDQFTLLNTIVVDNDRAQIEVGGDGGGRWIVNREQGTNINVPMAANWTLLSNAIAGGTADQLLFYTFHGPNTMGPFLATFISDNNTWYNPAERATFIVPAGHRRSFEEWQAYTGQDGQSHWGPRPTRSEHRVLPAG